MGLSLVDEAFYNVLQAFLSTSTSSCQFLRLWLPNPLALEPLIGVWLLEISSLSRATLAWVFPREVGVIPPSLIVSVGVWIIPCHPHCFYLFLRVCFQANFLAVWSTTSHTVRFIKLRV